MDSKVGEMQNHYRAGQLGAIAVQGVYKYNFTSWGLIRCTLVSSIRHHVAHPLEILGRQLLLEFLPRQPLEVGVAKGVVLEVGLAGHDAALEEKGLFPLLLDGSISFLDGLLDKVCHGDTADDPGVHVDTGGLIKYPLGAL